MTYEIGECPQFAPGMALPQGICENCGGEREKDHVRGTRAEARHTVFTQPEAPPVLSKDQKAQGVRSLGPFPTEVEYPCGHKATGGNGLEALPEVCLTCVAQEHEKEVKSIKKGKRDAARQ